MSVGRERRFTKGNVLSRGVTERVWNEWMRIDDTFYVFRVVGCKACDKPRRRLCPLI